MPGCHLQQTLRWSLGVTIFFFLINRRFYSEARLGKHTALESKGRQGMGFSHPSRPCPSSLHKSGLYIVELNKCSLESRSEQYCLIAKIIANSGKVKFSTFLCPHFLLDKFYKFMNRNLLVWPHTEHKFLTFIRQSSFWDESRTFSGFKSRCIIPFSWRYYTEREAWPLDLWSR